MGFLDTLLGRTKPVKPNLDQLFALSGASLTLQVATGLVPSGRAGVCAKPPTGPSFAAMQRDIDALLSVGADTGAGAGAGSGAGTGADGGAGAASGTAPSGGGQAGAGAGADLAPFDDGSGTAAAADLTVRHATDSFGYSWVVVDGGTVEDLVTRVHMVHSSLEDAGWGPQLLCSVFGFTPGPDPGPDAVTRDLFLVYLAKRGTFYPFAPSGHQQRDSELELRVRSVLGTDLPVEQDLARWFPLWDLPVA